MLRHQFGQNLVFNLDLLLEILDPFLFGLMASPALLLEGGRAVFKELLASSCILSAVLTAERFLHFRLSIAS